MLKTTKSKQWFILIAAVFLFLVYYFSQKTEIKTPSINTSQVQENIIISNKPDLELIKQHQGLPQYTVNTYQGTQPDGDINLDENGNVIIDKDLKRLFDYYLSAIGELPLDQMRKYLQQFAAQELNPDQLQQLLNHFDQYHSYLERADKYFQQFADDLNLQDKMKLLSDYRLDTLGMKMSNAFFADEQGYIEFVLTEKNTDELAQQQLNWLEAENQATEFQDVVLENRVFNNSENISPEEVHQYRIEEYGQEAADRLSQLDQHRAQWQSVVDGYFQQRQNYDNQQTNLSLEQINANYTTQELRRLEALWRIKQQ